MTWKPVTLDSLPDNEVSIIFKDNTKVYIGKRHQNKWYDYQFGIISEGVNGWSDEFPVKPLFINAKPQNGDYRGWEAKVAPSDGKFVWILDAEENLDIARFDNGWYDRMGNKLENVLCSLPLPPLDKIP